MLYVRATRDEELWKHIQCVNCKPWVKSIIQWRKPKEKTHTKENLYHFYTITSQWKFADKTTEHNQSTRSREVKWQTYLNRTAGRTENRVPSRAYCESVLFRDTSVLYLSPLRQNMFIFWCLIDKCREWFDFKRIIKPLLNRIFTKT